MKLRTGAREANYRNLEECKLYFKVLRKQFFLDKSIDDKIDNAKTIGECELIWRTAYKSM